MSLNLAMSFIGGPRFRALLVALFIAAFVWRRRWWSAAMLVAATGGMGMINTGLKVSIRRQRPAGLPALKHAGYSFPSGHTSGSVVFFGALGYLAWRMTRHRILTSVVLCAAGVLVGLIARSRVGLRAHHRSDVVAGYVAGTIWLALVLRVFARPLAREYE